MITAKIIGKITTAEAPQTMPGSSRMFQKICFQTIPQPDALGRTTEKVNYFDMFIYGKDEILQAWQDYNDKLPPPIVTATVYLIGRQKIVNGKHYNNITLRIKKLEFNYG